MAEDSTDSLLSMLAATAPGDAVLYLGDARAGLVTELLMGMDITTRLLVASSDSALVQHLQDDLSGDLRLSIHLQALDEFLIDIAAHRFALIVIAPQADTVKQHALELLAPGGVGVGLSGVPLPPQSGQWLRCVLAEADVDWMVSKRARPVPKRRRRRSRPVAS